MWTLTLVLILSSPDARLVYLEGSRAYATEAECVRALRYAEETTFLGWTLTRAECAPRTAV